MLLVNSLINFLCLYFSREAFTVWNTSATKLNRVPDGKVQDAFYKLNLYPTTEQGECAQ